jgi:hypothetical protein
MPTAQEFVRDVIAPALETINKGTLAARQLMLGVAIQESQLKYLRQIGGGPALGYFQMEPATHDDIWKTYLTPDKSGLSEKILVLAGLKTGLPDSGLLVTNHKYACAMARCVFTRTSDPLPPAGGIKAMAALWKTKYNTGGGAGTEDEYIANWKKFNAAAAFG